MLTPFFKIKAMALTLGNLYRVRRGNVNQATGFLVKGGTAAVTLLGDTGVPTASASMIDLNGSTLAEGLHSFPLLPEYIRVTTVAGSVEIIGFSVEDLGALA